MPLIKFHQVISFTSEDSKHRAENLLNGNGRWLCSPNTQSGTINIELQIDKATAINFIDIGNHNCAFISIDVGMSSWTSSQSFVSLLPSVVLMNPSDCRSRKNLNTVRMFRKDDLDKENVCKKWDRIRVNCSQPFIKGEQFGLAFLKLYSQENVEDAASKLDEDKTNKDNLMSFFTSKSVPQKMPESLQSLEQYRISSLNSDSSTSSTTMKQITSPISRAGKLIMARKEVPNESDIRQQKRELELEALNFLVSMNLTKKDFNSLRVSHIRTEFESRRNKPLNLREKLVFKNIALDYSAEKLRKLDLEEENSSNEIRTPGRKSTFNFKKFGNSPKVDDCEDSSSNLSRNDLALVDSVVTSSAGKRKRKGSISTEEIYSNGSLFHNKNKKLSSNSEDSDDDIIPIYSLNKSSVILGEKTVDNTGETQSSSSTSYIECPLCSDLYASDVIEGHAANCEGKEVSNSSPMNQLEECPVCEKLLESTELKAHIEECVERSFP